VIAVLVAVAGAGAWSPAKQWQGQAVYGPEEGRSLVLRYAPGEGQVVETGQELVRSEFTPGPFMWIDIDSFWLHEATLLDSKISSGAALFVAKLGHTCER